MILPLHIILALLSLAVAGLGFAKPSSNKLKVSYTLAAGTLASGVMLIIVNHASILRTCLTGIVFFAVVSLLNETARRKLAPQEN